MKELDIVRTTKISDTTDKAINALQHGVFSKSLILPGEDKAEFKNHVETYRNYFYPAGKMESDIVDKIAFLTWREQRLERAIAIIQRAKMVQTIKDMPEPVKRCRDEVTRLKEILTWYTIQIRRLREAKMRSDAEANAFFMAVYPMIVGVMSVAYNEQPVGLRNVNESKGVTVESAVNDYENFLESHRRLLHCKLRHARLQLKRVVAQHSIDLEIIEAEASLLPSDQSERFERERVSIERALIRQCQLLQSVRLLAKGKYPVMEGKNYETKLLEDKHDRIRLSDATLVTGGSLI